ncbi:MAG: signal peptidase I [Lachnospiraceae bacterium]|nr:signal peptidase I [Lachnospiraceae bacterium]
MSTEDIRTEEEIKNKEAAEPAQKVNVGREVLEWVIVLVISAALAFALDKFIIVNARIPSASMEPTIMTGDRLIGNRLAYIKEDPVRGDVIIFLFPDNEKEIFIKRVIGLPGETVQIREGKVYIDGASAPLDESAYITSPAYGDFGPFEVPEGAYFVMGDNRNNSMDSRYWNRPYVYKDKILGKAWARYYRHPSFIQ